MMKTEVLSPKNSSHPQNLSPLAPCDTVPQTALHSALCCIAESDCIPSPYWKGAWVVGSLSVEICQNYSADFLGPKEYNTPRPGGLTPWTQTFQIGLNFAEPKPNTLFDTLTTILIVWPQQCTQYTSICSVLFSCPGISLKGRVYEFPVLSMLSLPPHLLNHVTSLFFR